MGELGRRLCLEKSWMSRAIDGLVEEGLVVKQVNPADSRSWLVSLSGAGERRLRALNEQIEGHAGRVLDRIPAIQRAKVQQSLTWLLQALRDDAGLPAETACCTPPKQRGGKHVTAV